MEPVLDILSWFFLVSGSLFCVLGGVGIHRFPEFYCRLHASGMTDSLGAPLILVGLSIQAGFTLITVKLLTIWIFLYLTSPATTSALAQSAYWGDVRIKKIRAPSVIPDPPANAGSAES